VLARPNPWEAGGLRFLFRTILYPFSEKCVPERVLIPPLKLSDWDMPLAFFFRKGSVGSLLFFPHVSSLLEEVWRVFNGFRSSVTYISFGKALPLFFSPSVHPPTYLRAHFCSLPQPLFFFAYLSSSGGGGSAVLPPWRFFVGATIFWFPKLP